MSDGMFGGVSHSKDEKSVSRKIETERNKIERETLHTG